MRFGPFSELTKDFSPTRRARIEAIKAEMREEEQRLLAADAAAPQEGISADEGPQRHAPEGH